MAAPIVEPSSLFLFVVILSFVLPVVLNIPTTELLPCPLNWFVVLTDILSLPLMNPFATFFLEDRDLLNCLFEAVSDVIKELFHSLNKSKNFVPGFISVLHTFGRPLGWNPHIHCLLSEGGFSDDGFWRTIKYFNYSYLRKSFQTVLLNKLEKRIGPSFKKTKSQIYHKDKNGFYVYAKPNLCDPKSIIKYVSRYLGRPVIALSRIDSYDGENVTFHYNKHERVPLDELYKRAMLKHRLSHRCRSA